MTEPHLCSEGCLLNLLQPFHQQFLFPQILSHCDCALDFLMRLSKPPELHEQVSANTRKQMVANQGSVSSKPIHRIESSGGPLRHTNGDRPIQCHDGRRADLQQSVVEKNDSLPIGFFGCAGPCVTGSNGCLQSIVTGATTQSLRLF